MDITQWSPVTLERQETSDQSFMIPQLTTLREFPGHGARSGEASWSLPDTLIEETELKIQKDQGG